MVYSLTNSFGHFNRIWLVWYFILRGTWFLDVWLSTIRIKPKSLISQSWLCVGIPFPKSSLIESSDRLCPLREWSLLNVMVWVPSPVLTSFILPKMSITSFRRQFFNLFQLISLQSMSRHGFSSSVRLYMLAHWAFAGCFYFHYHLSVCAAYHKRNRNHSGGYVKLSSRKTNHRFNKRINILQKRGKNECQVSRPVDRVIPSHCTMNPKSIITVGCQQARRTEKLPPAGMLSFVVFGCVISCYWQSLHQSAVADLKVPSPAEPAQRQSAVGPALMATFATPLALQGANADVSRIERFFPPCHTPQAALPKSPNNSQVLSNRGWGAAILSLRILPPFSL